jgi:hypothetical protein
MGAQPGASVSQAPWKYGAGGPAIANLLTRQQPRRSALRCLTACSLAAGWTRQGHSPSRKPQSVDPIAGRGPFPPKPGHARRGIARRRSQLTSH